MLQHLRAVRKLNNEGLSLVELIVAISIGVIVSGSIAALITYAMRTYRNESVNTSMQYELQSNINTMMDEIMGSSVFVIKQNASGEPHTQYALFGRTNAEIIHEDDSKSKGFVGVIFVSSAAVDGKFNIYMDRIYEETETDVAAIAASYYATVSGAFATDPNPYLLGENATKFSIIPDPADPGDPSHPEHVSFDDVHHTYVNPIPVKVELQFERKGWGDKNYSKHVNDTTYLRNKVTEDVYVNGVAYSIKMNDN